MNTLNDSESKVRYSVHNPLPNPEHHEPEVRVEIPEQQEVRVSFQPSTQPILSELLKHTYLL